MMVGYDDNDDDDGDDDYRGTKLLFGLFFCYINFPFLPHSPLLRYSCERKI